MTWSDLTQTERTLILGIGGATLGAVVVSYLTTSRLQRGVPVRIEVDAPTRNLITTTTGEWTRSFDKLSSDGVPVHVRMFRGP
jgi:hypothetical protein